MAKIFPFKGTCFNAQAVGDLTKVTALPYDRINKELQDKYYNSSPYTIVRITKGREFPDDNEQNNVYVRAQATLKEYLDNGILVESSEPAIYVYFQEFTAPDGRTHTRKGMTVMVELEDYSSGKVKPHERTLSAPKEDRYKLLIHTDMHFGQIFQLYPDDTNHIMQLLEPHVQRPPDQIAFNEEENVTHKMWAVTDAAAISQVQSEMANLNLFIADGHHRYETAINYRNFRLTEYEGGPSTQHPKNAMMTLVGMSDPGLVVLPTHRVIFNLPDFEIIGFLAKLQAYFGVEERPSMQATQDSLDAVANDHSAHAYGLYHGGKWWFLRFKDSTIMDKLAAERSPDWRSLDVAILHEVILEHILGITKEAQAAKVNLSYDRLPEEAVVRVDKGTHQLAILMNPTKLSQIRDVAGKGEVMPQKSTDFFPKLITGLVCAKVDLGPKK